MRKSMIGFIASAAVFIAAVFLGQNFTTPPETVGDDSLTQGLELISDPHFQRGAAVLQPDGSINKNNLSNPYAPPSEVPMWQLAQWASRYPISPAGGQYADGGFRWANGAKAVTMFPDGSLGLAVNSETEFAGVWRKQGQAFPHLLLQQSISGPGGPMNLLAPALSEMTALNFQVDVQLMHHVRSQTPGFDPGVNTIHFLIYFSVQDLNKADRDNYGKYVWLGVPAFDDRQEFVGEGASYDQGTKSLIYTMPTQAFTQTSVSGRTPVHLAGDILPYAKKAVQAAYDMGLITSRNLADFKIGGMNLGFEAPGLYVTSMHVSGLSLRMQSSNYPRSFEFGSDAQGWSANADLVSQGHSDGHWIFRAVGDDPWILSPVLRVNADRVKKIYVRVANANGRDANSNLQIFWRAEGAAFVDLRSVRQVISNGGAWREYVIDLSQNPNWKGMIERMRFDLVDHGDGQTVGIDYIRFSQ